MKNLKKKIIIFDLDGTLLNTLEDLTDSTNFALSQFGYENKTIEQIRSLVGNGVAKLIERAIPGGINNPDFTTCLEIFKKHYSRNMCNKTKPYDGILKMLVDLKNCGCKTAVVSNKFDTAVKELCERYFPNLIDAAAGENEAAGIRKKPHPDMIFNIFKELDGDKNNSVYAGDSDVDILTAEYADLPCISVSWGFRDRDFLIENNAKIIVDNPEDIFDFLSGTLA